MKFITSSFVLLTALFLSTASWAQAPGKALAAGSSYDVRLLIREPDPALGNASFKPSARLRGLQGDDGVVYWLSADRQTITAYQGKKTLWAANVASALPKNAPGPLTVRQMAWCSNALFFSVGESGYVELDRQSGKVNQAGID
ncbi:hypothetical protein [Hymenobacter actinosclerus]|uniref:hypothetical protein n=1 Tax=Hymenobacter actinosclerus TaxID=82805 RepID=UPI0011608972|nr:hypothetical protein [Hymenobacter actinosclerus]